MGRTDAGTESYTGKLQFCARRGRSGRGAARNSRASARNITRLLRIFLPTFSGKTDGTKLQTSEAFAIWRGRATERTRPAACGGARDVEFVRTSRRRHSCGVAASTAIPVKPDNRADVGIGPYGGWELWRNRKSRPSETQLRCHRKSGTSGANRRRRADRSARPCKCFAPCGKALTDGCQGLFICLRYSPSAMR